MFNLFNKLIEIDYSYEGHGELHCTY